MTPRDRLEAQSLQHDPSSKWLEQRDHGRHSIATQPSSHAASAAGWPHGRVGPTVTPTVGGDGFVGVGCAGGTGLEVATEPLAGLRVEGAVGPDDGTINDETGPGVLTVLLSGLFRALHPCKQLALHAANDAADVVDRLAHPKSARQRMQPSG